MRKTVMHLVIAALIEKFLVLGKEKHQIQAILENRDRSDSDKIKRI